MVGAAMDRIPRRSTRSFAHRLCNPSYASEQVRDTSRQKSGMAAARARPSEDARSRAKMRALDSLFVIIIIPPLEQVCLHSCMQNVIDVQC